VFADRRTITQDPSFAIRCVVDVAIRALSPERASARSPDRLGLGGTVLS
jgi:hypothetical protein